MKYLTFLPIMLYLVTACTDPKQEKVDQLKSEAIAIHDEVMPRMGEISELVISLKKMRDALAEDTTAATEALRSKMSAQIYQLEEADEAMMSWMNAYEPGYDDQHPLDSAVVYYEKQKQQIAAVKEEMEKSIADAETFVEELK